MSQQACVITNVDTLAGYALAYRFLEEYKKERHTIRLLCRNKEGLQELERLGGEIHVVDYAREDQLRSIFNNVLGVILVPEHDQQRIKYAENVINAAKSQNVQHVCLVSIVGANCVQQKSGQYRHLNEYFQLEQTVKNVMGHEKSSVVRVSVFSQVFYLMAPLIEGQGVLRLPVQEQQKWTPVDLNDILEGFIRLCKEQKPRGAAFGSFKPVGGKDVYQFTPKEVIRMTELTKEINQGLGSSEEIRFEMCSPEETRNWMKQMRDDSRFKDRPEGKGQDSHRDRPFTFPLGRYLNDDMIDTILEIWQLANEGEMDITTPDLSQILGRDPQGIRQYFKSNRQQFRDLK